MKRRVFLQKTGLGTSGILLHNRLMASAGTGHPRNMNSFEVKSVDDLKMKDGTVALRITYGSSNKHFLAGHAGKIGVKNGRIDRTKAYFFHEESDQFDQPPPELAITADRKNSDVVVTWLREATGNTGVWIPLGNEGRWITIREVIGAGDLELESKGATATVSYLLDHEIGEIDPANLGIRPQGDRFCFTIMADPQGGNPFAHEKVHTRMRIHNAFIDESVRLVNELHPRPAFNLVLGDIVDGQGHHADFRAMNDMLCEVKVPTLYELGNHETRYRSEFTPGYKMDDFKNYFNAQKEFNGMEKLLYSFNLGGWHFIVWPDPLRSNFWETHPHYFDWLERDLEKYRNRPTLFFQHVPIHPVGINPLINYAESIDVKRTLFDILGRHGNVHYVFSGHVHIPMKASVKTAVSYKGMKLINLPAAGYRPRAFGEEDFNGGPSQGIAVVEIEGENATVKYKNVVNESFTYPEKLTPFDDRRYPLWLNHKWELANGEQFRNGSFRDGLRHWHRRYVYQEEHHSSNICETRKEDGKSCLYLRSSQRGYDAPGQDRLPQTINRICQVIRTPERSMPLINLSFRIDPQYYRPESLNGAIIWIEGFEKGLKRMNIVYSNNYTYGNLGKQQSQFRTVFPVHMEISGEPGEWYDLELNPYADFARVTEMEEFFLENIDVLALTFGTWTINQGWEQYAAAAFTGVESRMEQQPGDGDYSGMHSLMEGREIRAKDHKYLFWGGVGHPAGEHQVLVEDLNKYVRNMKSSQ